MFKAILFDLDGTLLDIDMDFFLTRYFREMGRMAAAGGYCDPQQLVDQILKSTDVMIRDIDPGVRNEESFMQHFFNSLPVDEVEMKSFFDEFYLTGFPRLQGYCKPFAGVPEMMAQVFANESKVVIATNAVFPRRAIQLRLDWAGIGHFPYEMLTTYENMHYCKPNPQYYEEIAANIGVKPSACLMVGNDVDEDLVAGEIGMKTFLVRDRLIDRGNSTCSPDWQGSLQDLFRFLEQMFPRRGI